MVDHPVIQCRSSSKKNQQTKPNPLAETGSRLIEINITYSCLNSFISRLDLHLYKPIYQNAVDLFLLLLFPLRLVVLCQQEGKDLPISFHRYDSFL